MGARGRGADSGARVTRRRGAASWGFLTGLALLATACVDPNPAWLAAPAGPSGGRRGSLDAPPAPQGAPAVGPQGHGRPTARVAPGSHGVVLTPRWISVPGRALSISATEVTVQQFRSCVEAGRCPPAHFDSGCNYGDPTRGDHPMNCASELAAQDFCGAVGGRVCTQDEWLAACRGADGRRFPYGDAFDLAACNSQSSTNRVEGRPLSTAPVGSFRGCEGGLPGLFDMGGNVAEWVGPCKGTYCKLRGGSYLSTDPVDRFAACVGVCAGNQ